MTNRNTPWRDTGNTTFEEFRAAICRRYQGGLQSPMCGEATAIYNAILPYGLTRLAAAMSWHELKNDTYPSSYGVRPEMHNAWCMKAPSGAWQTYKTYAEAGLDWAQRLTSRTGPYRNAVTLAELISVYAPGWDNNNESQYLDVLVREIDALPLLAEKGNAVPLIQNLAIDYGRYGLTNAQATKVIGQCFKGRSGKAPLAIVLHIQEGQTSGSLMHWATQAQASSTVMVNRDGTVLQVIPEADGPWTNGDTNNPSPKGAALLRRINGVNPNLVTLSIEAEGYSAAGVTPAQLDSIVWQVKDWMARYNIPASDVYKHADLNSVSRSFCPGPYYDQVMARLQDGTPSAEIWPGKPAWLPDFMVKELFPEADPAGPRTKAWLAYCASAGRAPRRVKFHRVGSPDELIEFSDGMLVAKDGKVLGVK